MKENTSQFFVTAKESKEIILSRQSDNALLRRVHMYLNHDINPIFNSSGPCFYFPRYLVTPNFETLHVVNLAEKYELPLILSEDVKTKFVSKNTLKKALCKMPILMNRDKNDTEILMYKNLIDFNTYNGSLFFEVKTQTGKTLTSLHQELCDSFIPKQVYIADESAWIDRNHRDNLKEQYKKILAHCCIHGILLESFLPEEQELIDAVFVPAYNEVKEIIGVDPLVVEHLSAEEECQRNWCAYPSETLAIINKYL